MKNKTLLIFSFSIALVSCVKNEAFSGNNEVVLTATNEAVKSHLGEILETSAPVLFDASDELAVVNSETSAPVKFHTGEHFISDGGLSADFYGEISENGPFCALFPFEYADPSTTVDRIVMNVPSQQTYSEHSFGISSNIAAATWQTGKSFQLLSLFGCMKVALNGNCSVKKITLEDNDSENALWGSVTAIPDPSTGAITDISVSNPQPGNNALTIVMDAAVALTAETPKDFFFVVPEGAFAKGMTMTIHDSNNQVIKVVSTDKDLTISRKSLRQMAPITISDAILFSGGAGTEANPYRIATIDDLNLLASYIKAGTDGFATAHYRQTRNIENATLVDHIGSYGSNGDHPFSGVYNGNGYHITNLAFSNATSEYGQGLFGYTKNAVVKNLNIDGYTNTKTDRYSGVVVGCSTESTVLNCNVTGEIAIKGNQGGGVVGRNSTNSTISNCTFTGSIAGSANCLGGITGLNANGSQVKNCKVEATITATDVSSGGIVGLCESSLSEAIVNCEFNGSITSTSNNCGGILGKKGNRTGGISSCKTLGAVNGISHVGGIIGLVEQNNDSAKPSVGISNCTNGADITASVNNAGGIVGNAVAKSGCYVKIDKCANNANITAAYNVGGIIGYATDKGEIVQVYNSVTSDCKIYATAADPSNHYARVGGIIGGTDKNSTADVNVINSCVINIKLQSDDTGDGSKKVHGIAGIVGSLYSNGNIQSCYSNTVTSDFSVPNGTINYKGAIVGYKKASASLYDSDYYDTNCSYKAFYSTNPCVGIATAQFTDGTLLANMNAAAKDIEGAANWIADPKSGFPVPSGVEVDPEEPENTVRILAIGNSFSCDAVEQYLYELFKAAGYNAIIGDCYIGGCTLQLHWENESSSTPSIKKSNSYRKIVKGVKSTYGNKSIADILQDEPWDYVVFQQGAGLYGKVDSHYPYLTNFLEYLGNYLERGKYKTGYQLNWAFPKSCTNDRFALYNWDQDQMYRECADCAKTLKETSKLDVIIPTGTAIQNGRQTVLGDTFNRDWGHLEYNYGRYTASCTWFEQITGIDVRTTTYKPSTVTDAQATLVRQAAHDAVVNPYEVTVR